MLSMVGHQVGLEQEGFVFLLRGHLSSNIPHRRYTNIAPTYEQWSVVVRVRDPLSRTRYEIIGGN